ncbi:phage tail protein [Pseudomonas oryzihabitans]|uniref:phage tail protein n=1 Tax=Pseudomonas oryzihabitans TaxID=47885 RepID=UPI003C6E8E5B
MSAGLETLTVASGDRSYNAAFTRWVGNKIGERAGTIVFFAMTAAPLGYLKANSAAVSRTTYAMLFAAIGTTFGAGDGSTTFKAARRPRRIHTRLGRQPRRGWGTYAWATRPVRTFYSATAGIASARSQ